MLSTLLWACAALIALSLALQIGMHRAARRPGVATANFILWGLVIVVIVTAALETA